MSFVLRAGKYRVLGRLAEGGMGVVYRAMMTTLEGVEKPVALKVLRTDLAASGVSLALFLEEAKTVMALTHGNVVQAVDVGRIDERLFIALELVEGVDLAALVAACEAEPGGHVPLPVALFVAVETLKGLDYAHRRTDSRGKKLGLVHCDVSPSNVLLSFEGEVKVADFGIAQTARRVAAEDGAVRGKLPYMAPEQLRGGALDLRADVYAVGALLYEMLTGRRLVTGESRDDAVVAILDQSWPRPTELVPELDAVLEAIVLRALAAEPRDRFPTAAAFRDELESYAVGRAQRLSSTELADLLDRVVREGLPSNAPSSAPSDRSPAVRPAPDALVTAEFDEILGRELAPVLGPENYSVYTATGIAAAAAAPVAIRVVGAPVPEAGSLPATRVMPAAASAAVTPTDVRPRLPARARWIVSSGVLLAGVVALVAAVGASGGQHGTQTTRPAGPVPMRPPPVARASSPAPVDVALTPAAGPTPPLAQQPTVVRPAQALVRVEPLHVHRVGDRHAARTLSSAPPPAVAASAPAVRSASLSVNALPWADVLIDGVHVRTTPLLAYDVPAGRRVVALRGPSGRIEREIAIDLAPGEHRRISVDLRTPQ